MASVSEDGLCGIAEFGVHPTHEVELLKKISNHNFFFVTRHEPCEHSHIFKFRVRTSPYAPTSTYVERKKQGVGGKAVSESRYTP
jgi:hypothetical protein